MRRALAGFFAGLALAGAAPVVANHVPASPTDVVRARDRFNLADRWRVRVYEDGSTSVSYRVRRMDGPGYVRVRGGVGVPW